MKNLQQVLEGLVADAMRAGVERYMIDSGTDSAEASRQSKAWIKRSPNYQTELEHYEKRAVRDVSDALMRMRLTAETAEQQGLF